MIQIRSIDIWSSKNGLIFQYHLYPIAYTYDYFRFLNIILNASSSIQVVPEEFFEGLFSSEFRVVVRAERKSARAQREIEKKKDLQKTLTPKVPSDI